MATIRKRRRKDGSFSYLAQIRISRRGQPDFSESRTFPRKAMAEEWAKRRELELNSRGGVLSAKWRGVTLGDAIERYLHEFAQDAGRSKRATIQQLLRFPIARVQVTDLTSEQIIEHAVIRRNSGIKPSTINQDITWLGIILKTAAAAWKMPVALNEFESAKLLMRSKGLVSRPDPGTDGQRVRRSNKSEPISADRSGFDPARSSPWKTSWTSQLPPRAPGGDHPSHLEGSRRDGHDVLGA